MKVYKCYIQLHIVMLSYAKSDMKRTFKVLKQGLHMAKSGYTNIRLRRETVRMLQEVGRKAETYDQIVLKLIKKYKKE